jgi:hypothetical protein
MTSATTRRLSSRTVPSVGLPYALSTTTPEYGRAL